MLGATLTLIGSFGLLRLPTFYERIHAPTLGTSWGTAGIVYRLDHRLLGQQGRPVLHELLIGGFARSRRP